VTRRLELLASLGLAGLTLGGACVDTPNPISPPDGGAPAQALSELGIFEPPLAALQPVPGIIAYDVNVSLYSDGAQKHRFLYLPPGTQLQATSDRWTIPTGAYLIKTFYYPNDARDPDAGVQLLETRFLVKQADGFLVSTYVWNTDQSDAVVSGGNLDIPTHWIDADGVLHDDYFHVPGTSLCQTCHQDRALGIRTRQLDMPGTYADGTSDQISHLIAAGALNEQPPPGIVLTDPLGDGGLDARARSYLDANCAHCHAVGGEAYSTNVLWDYEDTVPTSLPLCMNVESVSGDDQVIVPGEPQSSEFLARMWSPDPFVRMPQGPTHDPDGAAIAVLSEWVQAMTPPGCPQ
jgi:uncharacterized repeat protein (TIGR03806 family)